jgi:hypothetical protein
MSRPSHRLARGPGDRGEFLGFRQAVAQRPFAIDVFGRASIHWTMPKEYLLSSHLSDPKYQILGTPSRSLTEVEERLV